MNARPQFLPPGTSRRRRALAWLAVLAAGAILGFAILFIAAFAVEKIFPPSDAAPAHQKFQTPPPVPARTPSQAP